MDLEDKTNKIYIAVFRKNLYLTQDKIKYHKNKI